MNRSWVVHANWLHVASILLACLLVLLPPSQQPAAQDADESTDGRELDEPAWLSYERGMHEFRAGQYGIALLQFRAALDTQPVFPEALAAIGSVYRRDRNIALAKRYLLDALKQSDQLYVPEEKYAISYDLAELYRITGDTKERLDVFKGVIEEHFLSEDGAAQTTEAYMRVLSQAGIDRLLTLYRLEIDFSYEAYARSGILFVKTGRYNNAVRNLAVASIQALSTAITYIRQWELDYEYTRLDDLLQRIATDPVLRDFAASESLYEVLYYLAAALYGDTSSASAFSIWSAVQGRPEAGDYQRRSALRLESPELEPLIDY